MRDLIMLNKEDTMEFKKPEILAPAGDMAALLGAIKGGADAAYLGVGEFNARQGAKNFTLDDLEGAIDLAHSHGVLVFFSGREFYYGSNGPSNRVAVNLPTCFNPIKHRRINSYERCDLIVIGQRH